MKTAQKPKVGDATESKLKTTTTSSKQPKNISTFFKQTKRNLSTNTSKISISKTSNNLIKSETLILPPKDEEDLKWEPLLNMGKSELFLPLTFPTGQTFRWKQTGLLRYTGVIDSHLISLRQQLADDGNDDGNGVFYFVHSNGDKDDAKAAQMLGFHLRKCKYLGTVEGFKFYEFPSPERLSSVSEDEFRVAGFGYRNPDCKNLEGYGKGPKVAACIALFSLDQHHAIPVDTHVWQIATRYLIPELAGARLTPKLCNRVAEAFVNKYGKYAGWAQTLLFIAELPSQKALLATDVGTVRVIKPALTVAQDRVNL
ncbi:hypothetical protein C5167_026165 [Papaver somniferum]|nr:hypothetical protein C5167_026165 [Papaver somniferum]